jgi:hypothetical protein
MKHKEPEPTVALALAATLTMMSAATLSSQTQITTPQQPVDTIAALVADAQGLPLVPTEDQPPFGTYWEVRNSLPCLGPPLPCPLFDPTTPVWAIGGGQFLADLTAGPLIGPLPSPYRHRALTAADYTAILLAQANELQTFIAQVQARQLSLQSRLDGAMNTLDNEIPPLPGEGGTGTNDWSGGGTCDGWTPTTNDLWLEIRSMTLSNATADLVIHPPWNVSDGVYDLFSTTNLVPEWWGWVLRCAPGQTNLTLTNLTAPRQFFILGLTNDTDSGGMSDAWEGLLGLNPNDPNDDRVTPLVGISTLDSVAIEQVPTNTASFVITRLGGHLRSPLTLGLQLSGTATLSNNYTLTPLVTLDGTNALVTVPAGETNLVLTLTPLDDHVTDGAKTATLTLTTNIGPCEVNPAQASATAWILEQYTYTYTTVTQFNLGVLNGLEAVSTNDDGHLRFKTNLPPQFPYINIACSARGTVARINTTNGQMIGEYLTAPAGLSAPPNPSRTTVDEYGNVWVANRDDNLAMNGQTNGSITRIGLIIGGTRYQKNPGGSYTTNAQGQYVKLGTTEYNTCIDRDGDGYIRTSMGQADILPWSNERGGRSGVDSEGGVSTAEDEAITEYTRVVCIGARTVAVDKFNDLWVGGYFSPTTSGHGPKAHQKINGLTGLPVPNSVFNPGGGGYGAVIDGLGNLWSSSSDYGVLRLVPPAVLPPISGDWEVQTPVGVSPYGIAVDPVQPYIWQTSGGYVFRWQTNGMSETDGNGNVILYPNGNDSSQGGNNASQGLAVDANGHVWVAHGKEITQTLGHLHTNAAWVGNVDLHVSALWAEYFANTNLAGWPALTNVESPLDFDYHTNGWPASEPPTNSVPANSFSARWSGVVQPQAQGDHVFYVAAEAGAAFRLRVNGVTLIDNWTNPATNSVELEGTNWLGTNVAYDLRLEYAHFTNAAWVRLSWLEPGMTNKEVIPAERFGPFLTPTMHFTLSQGATGVSVDAAGKIWVGCFDTDTAVRIDPNAGPLAIVNGETNHVGLVDMMVDLADGSWYPAPYTNRAQPYNYSDMTGFNERVVNPALAPLKGYWAVIHDSGVAGELWNRVVWNAFLTSGCLIEVYVRAEDDRAELANAAFVVVTNSAPLVGVKGRYIEVRLAMTRDDPAKQPLLCDLTLCGSSSGFVGSLFLDDAGAYETENASFSADLTGPEPLTYQWYVMPAWTNDWVLAQGVSGPELLLTNVDLWDDLTLVGLSVSNAAGETVWLGPAMLSVYPLPMRIPGSGSYGPAERYPAKINVGGEPTNGLARVEVTLYNLRHSHPEDMDILLVSPSGLKIMLMSDAGGSFGVTNATLVFHPLWQSYPFPPDVGTIPSNLTTDYSTCNYGDIETQLPGAPVGPYSTDLNELFGTNPNGLWYLYIYDDTAGGTGVLQDSWGLQFFYE